MIELLRQPIGAVFVGVIALYFLLALFVPSKVLIEIGDAFAIPMAIAAFVVYFRNLMDKRARAPGRPFDSAHITIAAIAGAWFTNFLDRQTRLLARLFDITIADSSIIALFLMLLTYFAALHLYAIGIRLHADRPPIPGTRIIWGALAAGACLAAGVLYHEWPHLKGALPQ